MPLNFTAIDFETANSSRESACSVGLVKVRDGVVVDETSWFIKPEVGFDEFLPWNTKIHGIYREDVQDARGWEEQLDELVDFVGDDHFVAHNAAFDMAVIRAASAAARVECPPNAYACSLQIARKTYSLDSYRLPVAAMAAGFEDFRHHDALADAEACAAIIIHAAERHEVNSIETLAGAAGVKISQLRPAVATPVI